MASMARHGSVGGALPFSGFSVCQPALGAALQWLPAIGTPELDTMINSFLPGPASIQDKRAHISMDFFEYYRQTGENFKFYAVPAGASTPVTASPAGSALYDSGYASSFNHSPVLSDQGSWTQSPTPFAPVSSRPSVSKKSPASSSRQQTVDFASHPGMRILTKDGRDVTNSASRGCKTKEQRDHAHLMRIIKACDACRKKKVRCDPSHRKQRAASQTSAAQAEQRPAKRSKKAANPPPVGVDAPADFLTGDAIDTAETTLSLDTTYPQDFEQFWNDFITLPQEPVAAEPAIDDFLFDSFTDPHNYFSPSSGSSATSPSQTFTPFTPVRSGASPITSSDLAVDVAGDVFDSTVPYLNPGVALGTNYVDFNLYSPGPEVFDEDPVLQMRDLASRQHSPQSPGLATGYSVQHSPRISSVDTGVQAPVTRESYAGEQFGGARDIAPASPVDLSLYYDPGSTADGQLQRSTHRSPSGKRLKTNHNRHVDSGGSRVPGASADKSLVSSTATASPQHTSSTVFASIPESSVSPSIPARPRRITSTSKPGGTNATCATRGTTVLSIKSSLLTVAVHHNSSQHATSTTPPTAGDQSRHAVGRVVRASSLCNGQSVSSSPVPGQPLTGRGLRSPASPPGQHTVQRETAAASAVLATMVFSTLPTRRNVAVEEHAKSFNDSAFSFQLAVFGLVSLLCVCALQQTHLASQVDLVNILAITSLSLARLALRCYAGQQSSSGGATHVAPSSTTKATLLPPSPSGIVDNVKSKIQYVGRSLQGLQSPVLRRAGNFVPRLLSVRTLRV
ncbi:hypothetical protein N0V88_003439 [Collariella sp. IMI 366227]|nr:hypothetical protein N0V88_003439 [Collariella sp. IMI 366227]